MTKGVQLSLVASLLTVADLGTFVKYAPILLQAWGENACFVGGIFLVLLIWAETLMVLWRSAIPNLQMSDSLASRSKSLGPLSLDSDGRGPNV